MTKTTKMPDAYAEKNTGLAKEVAKCRECMQQNEIRIEELDTENLKIRAYVVKLQQNFDRAEKRVGELEAKLSSLEAILTTNRVNLNNNLDNALNIIRISNLIEKDLETVSATTTTTKPHQTVTNTQRQGSLLSSAEISSSIWTDNELTLVTKTTSITPNTLRLHAFNSYKSN